MILEQTQPLAPLACPNLAGLRGGGIGSGGPTLQVSVPVQHQSASPQRGAITCTQKPCPRGPCPEPGACCPHCEPGQPPASPPPLPILILGPQGHGLPSATCYMPRGCLPTHAGSGQRSSELKQVSKTLTAAWA